MPRFMGYGWLECVVRVQSVTWAAVVGCPCDRRWLVGVVLFTLCSQCQARGQALIPLPSRERGTEVVVHLCLVMSKSWFFSFFQVVCNR